MRTRQVIMAQDKYLRIGLNSGGACLPHSFAPLNKPAIGKIIAEDVSNTTPELMECQSSRDLQATILSPPAMKLGSGLSSLNSLLK